MARIRTLKPEFWDSPSTARADLAVRLTFMAMWNWADDSGHGTANLKELEAFCWPNDDVRDLPRASSAGSSGNSAPVWRNFAEVCGEVAEAYGVVFYRVAGRPYYEITNFQRHQSKDYRATSKYPMPAEGEIFDVTSGNAISGASASDASDGPSVGSRGNSAPPCGKSAIGTGEQGIRGSEEQGSRGGGEAPAPNETKGKKTKDGNTPTPSPSDSASDSTPADSPSDSRGKEPVVDMSGTSDLSPASLKRRFESLMGEAFEDDTPLESMDPAGLLDYIIRRQTENLGEPPISRSLKSDLEAITYFQSTHGPERAARMLRYVFETKKGQMKVGSKAGSEVEDISAAHFREAMSWWHVKIDQASREAAEREAEREAGVLHTKSGFTFSSSLW